MADYYKISGETLIAIADRTRAMAGTSKKLTPDEIIYWLGRVIYLPQGNANAGTCTLDFVAVSGAVGAIVTVNKCNPVMVSSDSFEFVATARASGILTE